MDDEGTAGSLTGHTCGMLTKATRPPTQPLHEDEWLAVKALRENKKITSLSKDGGDDSSYRWGRCRSCDGCVTAQKEELLRDIW